MSDPKIGFELRRVTLSLDDILPVRQVKDPRKHIGRYGRILKSLKEVGLIEPLVVYPHKGLSGKYLLLDGHIRHHALRKLGATEAECIISTDDECYTYNARISRINSIQEHRMIKRAVQNGVRPEKIAAALNIPLLAVKASITLLDGINEEAADLLKDKGVTVKAIKHLKRVNAVRQIEIAELMVSANNYSAVYAEGLVLATSEDQVQNPTERRTKKGMSVEDIAKMEEELSGLEKELKVAEGTYGENVLNLTVSLAYVKRLLDNQKVTRFLRSRYPGILSALETVVSIQSL
jgi:ParB-like chromosome segregation protein Spo0J